VKPLTAYNAAANFPSRERRRAEAMGFEFEVVEVVKHKSPFRQLFIMRGIFKCVCGKHESFAKMIDGTALHYSLPLGVAFDPAAYLRGLGSFSRDHLLKDGYPPETVDEILERGRQFDMENPR